MALVKVEYFSSAPYYELHIIVERRFRASFLVRFSVRDIPLTRELALVRFSQNHEVGLFQCGSDPNTGLSRSLLSLFVRACDRILRWAMSAARTKTKLKSPQTQKSYCLHTCFVTYPWFPLSAI